MSSPKQRFSRERRARGRSVADSKAPNEALPSRAKVFWNGRSQAIRLPKALRVASPEVVVYKLGRRIVIEEPNVEVDELGWPLGFWDLFGALEPDFDVGDRSVPHERDDPLARNRHG